MKPNYLLGGISRLGYGLRSRARIYPVGILLAWVIASSCADSSDPTPPGGDQRAWSVVKEPAGADYHGVWVSPSAEVFVVGENGSALRSADGENWTELNTGVSATLRGVYGVTSEDVYAVGAAGTMLHFDGAAWSPFPSPSDTSLFAVTITADGGLFVVGDDGLRARFAGTAWEAVTEQSWYLGVWGASETDVFAVGAGGDVSHYDGVSWEAMPNPAGMPLFDVWGTSARDVYAVGFDGIIIHYDGNQWVMVDSGQVTGHLSALRGVWGASTSDVLAVGGYNLWGDEAGAHDCVITRSDGGTWTVQASPTTLNLADVFGLDGVVYAVGDQGVILRY